MGTNKMDVRRDENNMSKLAKQSYSQWEWNHPVRGPCLLPFEKTGRKEERRRVKGNYH